MPKNRKKHSVWKPVVLILLGLSALALYAKTFMHGNNVALFNTKGSVAREQLDLMLLSVGLMLVLAIPTMFLLYFFAWRYRESSGKKARHDPNRRGGPLLNVVVWTIPAMLAIVLASIMWPATHRLEPQKQIASNAEPLTIQVVALRWKWLFIYPEQQIATVNFVQLPKDAPVTFQLTADEAPMSSFWIPNLGGMLYAMNGHVNKLNLLPETPGDYPGSSAEINGAGFAGMKFTARVGSSDDFEHWVDKVRQSGGALDAAEYDKLLEPSEYHPAAFYGTAEDDLYATVVNKYMGTGHDHKPAEHHGGH